MAVTLQPRSLSGRDVSVDTYFLKGLFSFETLVSPRSAAAGGGRNLSGPPRPRIDLADLVDRRDWRNGRLQADLQFLHLPPLTREG